jgi:hypothetical protein
MTGSTSGLRRNVCGPDNRARAKRVNKGHVLELRRAGAFYFGSRMLQR